MPWRDWQFWVVTVAALGGLILVGRAVLPKRRKGPKQTKATLTVDGKKV